MVYTTNLASINILEKVFSSKNYLYNACTLIHSVHLSLFRPTNKNNTIKIKNKKNYFKLLSHTSSKYLGLSGIKINTIAPTNEGIAQINKNTRQICTGTSPICKPLD